MSSKVNQSLIGSHLKQLNYLFILICIKYIIRLTLTEADNSSLKWFVSSSSSMELMLNIVLCALH